MREVAVYIVGLFVLSSGVTLSIRSGLGVSPVSSLPYIISVILGASVGMVVAVVMLLLVLVQVMLLRSRFKLANLSQLATSVVFGFFVDFVMLLTRHIMPEAYWLRAGLLAFSVFLLASGIAIMMQTKITPLPFESMVAAVAHVTGFRFHILKVVLDSTFAASALTLSLLFLGEIHGVREGTILTALFVGRLLPVCGRIFGPAVRRVLA